MESSETDHSDWDRADGTAGKSHSRKRTAGNKSKGNGKNAAGKDRGKRSTACWKR